MSEFDIKKLMESCIACPNLLFKKTLSTNEVTKICTWTNKSIVDVEIEQERAPFCPLKGSLTNHYDARNLSLTNHYDACDLSVKIAEESKTEESNKFSEELFYAQSTYSTRHSTWLDEAYKAWMSTHFLTGLENTQEGEK